VDLVSPILWEVRFIWALLFDRLIGRKRNVGGDVLARLWSFRWLGLFEKTR
jgi:hypothetical protein